MKLKMTVNDAIEFAREWSRGMTYHEDSQGWRVVCMVLADEVNRQRGICVSAHDRLLRGDSDAEILAILSNSWDSTLAPNT